MPPFRKKPKSPTSKCKKCQKFVFLKQNSICCDSCDNWFHLKCSTLTKSEFDFFVDPKNSDIQFFCSYCENYPCGKCNVPVFDHQNSIMCEGLCGKWFHLKCTKITLKMYTAFNKNPEKSLPWFCNACYSPPFSGLSESEFRATNSTDNFEKSTAKEIKRL